MDGIQLSICIATFNRAAVIGETLQSILTQMKGGVEVVIADGASTDGTQNVVRSFQQQNAGLSLVCLEKKGGVDHDYCEAVKRARGEYVWLFTDDDLLKPGAIATVLEATREGHDLVFVNAEVRTPDFKEVLQAQRVKKRLDHVYSSADVNSGQLLADLGSYLSFIGGVLIKRKLWEEREKKKYFGSSFIHLGVIFQTVPKGTALFVAHPWITIRYGNAEWRPRSFKIWMFDFPELIWSFTHFPEWARRRVVSRYPWKRWEVLLMARAKAQYSPIEYSNWLKPRLHFSPRRFLSWVIAVSPIAPMNFLARILVKYLFRKSPSITLYDLESVQAHK